jgi:hypothetical protein
MDCEEDLTIEATRRIFPGKEKAPGRKWDTTTLHLPTPNSRPINTDIDDNEYAIDPTTTISPSTWGPLTTIQRTMEGTNTTSLALFSSFPRLSVTISHEAQPLANQTLTIQCAGTNSSRHGGKDISETGCHRTSPSQDRSFLSTLFTVQEPTKRRRIQIMSSGLVSTLAVEA